MGMKHTQDRLEFQSTDMKNAKQEWEESNFKEKKNGLFQQQKVTKYGIKYIYI